MALKTILPTVYSQKNEVQIQSAVSIDSHHSRYTTCSKGFAIYLWVNIMRVNHQHMFGFGSRMDVIWTIVNTLNNIDYQ